MLLQRKLILHNLHIPRLLSKYQGSHLEFSFQPTPKTVEDRHIYNLRNP